MSTNKTAQTQYSLVHIIYDNFDTYKIDINSSYETVTLPRYINDLKADMLKLNTDVYILGEDELPELDIRNQVHDEPDIIFACVDVYDCVSYYGLIKKNR